MVIVMGLKAKVGAVKKKKDEGDVVAAAVIKDGDESAGAGNKSKNKVGVAKKKRCRPSSSKQQQQASDDGEKAAEMNNPSSRRRVSPRIASNTTKRAQQQQKQEHKEKLVHKRVQYLDDDEDGDNADADVNDNQQKQNSQLVVNNAAELECTSAAAGEESDKARFKKTLRLFNKLYLQLIQEEEIRCNRVQRDGNNIKGSKCKVHKAKGKKEQGETKRKAKRPDLKTISKMMESNNILYPKKRIGSLPGIDVGHQFYSRAEMVVVGIHSHWLKGIDFMGHSYQKDYPDYKLPLAVAIVLSGIYEDDLDKADNVVYTGQGGNNLLGNKRQIGDQKMEQGNLALKNSMEQNLPVRVIRGHKCPSSYCGKVYTYDGLYKVLEYRAEKGLSDFTVYKFILKRVEGQPTLTTNQVQYINHGVPQSFEEIRGLVCKDISGGQEPIPIPATNLIDDPPVPPTGFKYSRYMKISGNITLPTTEFGCNCKGKCIEPRDCACASLNGSDFPYVNHDGGRLIEAKDIVYECGPGCGCGPDCVNRTSQKGIRYHFEVYRTPMKGWAVRSWDFIRSGALVCEYIGILKKSADVESSSENNYIFDIDCVQTMNGLEGRQRRSKDVVGDPPQSSDMRCVGETEYCIDACSVGNIARFINHSCEPNLFVQCVLSDHRDVKLARVLLFASDNIPPLQELTYDYGYAVDSVLGPDGKVKQMACHCCASECRKRLF